MSYPIDPGPGRISLEATRTAGGSPPTGDESSPISSALGCLLLFFFAFLGLGECNQSSDTPTSSWTSAAPSTFGADPIRAYDYQRFGPQSPQSSGLKFAWDDDDDFPTGSQMSARYTFIVPLTRELPEGSTQKTIVTVDAPVELIEVSSIDEVPNRARVLRGDVKVYVGHLTGYDRMRASVELAEAVSTYAWEYYPMTKLAMPNGLVSPLDPSLTLSPELRPYLNLPNRAPPPEKIYVVGTVSEVHGPTTNGFSIYDVTVTERRPGILDAETLRGVLPASTYQELLKRLNVSRDITSPSGTSQPGYRPVVPPPPRSRPRPTPRR